MEQKLNKPNSVKYIIAVVACIIIGITFIASGSGKAIGFGEVPGQTIEFLGDMLPKELITPFTVFVLYDVFIPFIFPAIELLLGIFLIIGFMPRLMAIITIPLSLVLMTNNIWSISQGMDKFPQCVCFGIWEKIFGGLTPVQALSYDILIFILALIIIFLHPGAILSSREWVEKLFQKKAS
jgi:uncharacterized membrane protein YphA (DoxX/SURF4 family)